MAGNPSTLCAAGFRATGTTSVRSAPSAILLLALGCASTTTDGGAPAAGGSTTSAVSATGGSDPSGLGGSRQQTASGLQTSAANVRVLFDSISPTQPAFMLENNNPDPNSWILLSELGLRYWFTPEGPVSSYSATCAQIDSRGSTITCDQVIVTITDASLPFMDIEFDVPSTWRFWGTDSISRLNLQFTGKPEQGLQPDLTNDYSYVQPSGFTVDERVAVYQNDVLVWGQEPQE
jgi:hypothetical protein